MRLTWNIVAVGAAVVVAVSFGFLYGNGLLLGHWVVIFAAWLVTAFLLGKRAKTAQDPWLPRLMILGMLAKLSGSWLRLFVRNEFYDRGGDAGRYHRFGLENAEIWRSFQIPEIATAGGGGDGTRFTSWVTGLLYTPYQPDILGGYWMFGLLAFVGQFALYLAFRRWAPAGALKRYAILVFFWPTIVYWPSSIGKEALIMLPLGVGAWGVAELYRRYHFRWLPVIVASMFIIAMVRVHVAALFAVSALAGAFLSRSVAGGAVIGRRPLVLLVGLALLVPLALGLSEEFDLGLDSSISVHELEPAFEHVEDKTGKGGSAVEGGTIRSITDTPAGVLRVLFRPLPNEVSNLQMLAASVEGLLLLGLIAWRAPRMFANARQIRRSPYLVFCLMYCALFIWAWSSIANLGILARQRSLVLPFVLALVAALGWNSDHGAVRSSEYSAAGRKHKGGDEEEFYPMPG